MIAKLCAAGMLWGAACGQLTTDQRLEVWHQGFAACQAGVNPSVIYSEKHSEQWREAWLDAYSPRWCHDGWNKTK